MLTKRVIPCLDVAGGRVVKGVNFVDLRDAGDPVEAAAAYDAAGADELVYLDIQASVEGRRALLDLVAATANQLFIPLTVGGGVTRLEDFHDLLRAGADKVAVNSAAVREPQLVSRAAQRYGSQCVVAAVDVRRAPDQRRWSEVRRAAGDDQPGAAERGGAAVHRDLGPRFEVFTHGGRRATGLDALDWCARLVDLGAGEILLTSMDRDGTKAGFDLELLAAVVARVRVPVIASGGAGGAADFVAAARAGASGLLAATLFHFGELSVGTVKRALAEAGEAVRELA